MPAFHNIVSEILVTFVANLTESNYRVSLNSRRYNLVINPANMLNNTARNYPYTITKLLQISWNHKEKKSKEEELDFTLIYTSMFLMAKVLGNDNGHSKSVHFCPSVLVDCKKMAPNYFLTYLYALEILHCSSYQEMNLAIHLTCIGQ